MNKSKILIIAEAGVNHNGDLGMAKKLVDTAAEAGADFVKFQTFNAKNLVTATAKKADYQVKNTNEAGSQLAMLKKLELSHQMHFELRDHARSRGIGFLSTPFDSESLQFLTQEIGVPLVKLSSGEVTNGPFLFEAARTKKPIILSTGMATAPEVEAALRVIAFALKSQTTPKNWEQVVSDTHDFKNTLRGHVTILHCTTDYPCAYSDVNLLAMRALGEQMGLDFGYSDHTSGIAISLAAAALGAKVLEKHFTLDRTLPGPDHVASLEPAELKALVSGVRQIEQGLGSSHKAPSMAELKNLPIARRSLVSVGAIDQGAHFTALNFTSKRPGTGLSPMLYWDLLGKKASRRYEADELLVEAVPLGAQKKES